MKKITLIAMLFITGLFTSCQKDFLDTEAVSSLDDKRIFSIPGLTQLAVDGIKVPMGETNSYRGRYLPNYGFNTDTEWYNSSETASSKTDLCNYNCTKTNTEMNTDNNVWAMMYQGIERANICIRGIRTYGNPAVGNEMGYLLGEALTLRAVYYADLLKTWGDVPARFVPITTETVYLPKTNRDIIYKQIIADLGEAATLVPWPNGSPNTTNVERVNKAFVKGLRARLALAASGYQRYPDMVRRSTDPALSVANMYPLALAECQSVIASNTARLEPTFEGFWRKYNQEVITAGGESLWEIPFEDGRGRMLFTFAVKHTTNDQYHNNGANRGGVAGPLPTVFYDYDDFDTRRDVTCVPYIWGASVPAVNGVAKQELTTASINKWYFGKYRYEWMTRKVDNTNDDGVNKIYMRYAEVLLMAAETANQLSGPSAAAPYLKEIRRRAFPVSQHATKVDAYVAALSSQTAMQTAIVEEHKFEFTGEMERKQALIRWNLLKTNLDLAKAKMYRLQTRTGEYATVPTTIYSKYNTDGITLSIYGLNRGENTAQIAPYVSRAWNTLPNAKIDALYNITSNPDDKQFWPIWDRFIISSNGQLVNDYGY